jgi:hypothetical protein
MFQPGFGDVIWWDILLTFIFGRMHAFFRFSPSFFSCDEKQATIDFLVKLNFMFVRVGVLLFV